MLSSSTKCCAHQYSCHQCDSSLPNCLLLTNFNNTIIVIIIIFILIFIIVIFLVFIIVVFCFIITPVTGASSGWWVSPTAKRQVIYTVLYNVATLKLLRWLVIIIKIIIDTSSTNRK